MLKSQFHHYIPRFILKTFSDNFALTAVDSEFFATPKDLLKTSDLSKEQLVDLGRVKTKAKKKKGKNKGATRPLGQQSHHINVYHIENRTTVQSDVARAYGIDDMYRDISEEDCMKFEKLLAQLECVASNFIRKIWNGSDLSMTRTELQDMKKFLAIMMYRGPNRRGQYYNVMFDQVTFATIRMHMVHNNIRRIQDVWFENLKWLIKTPFQEIMDEAERAKSVATEVRAKNGARGNSLKEMRQYQGPIHVAELLDFYHQMTFYVCIWEAEEGSEFILSESCFGSFEGDGGVCFHNFFVVSPRYAIVLVRRDYMYGTMDTLPLRKSWFSESLHANPETVYVKGPPLRNFTVESHYTPNDIFKYTRIKVPKQDVFLVNSIFLDARRKFLTYKSSASMLKCLRFYDKVKHDKFLYKYDYSILKRQLFNDLNRTHSS
ncbi:hypothetical protein EMPS_05175 [Entomortierella parvispora]|uniref:DUF4238 domain-containing protein n=1 Tax=Entomortierella parvispora TaxID=205924 RepID=A0A9P3LW85_9FUNG|nr:hypothetical protein EMPS_05175 [Entomortierella parvispora]